ncbi:MAG: hypothetical protein MZV64_04025 [Ignavibacteriales bacterium]|nr:hypothetical protein [Ignavibacteriales bacterium]
MVNKKGEIRFGMAGIQECGRECGVQHHRRAEMPTGRSTDIFDLDPARQLPCREQTVRMEAACPGRARSIVSGRPTGRNISTRNRTDDSIFLEKVMRQAADYLQRKNSSQRCCRFRL